MSVICLCFLSQVFHNILATDCNTDNVNKAYYDMGKCRNRHNYYMLVGLGLQFQYTEDVIGGFVVQKGHPQKARWMVQHAVYTPLLFETTITTPDGETFRSLLFSNL